MENNFYASKELNQIYHATRSDGPHASSPDAGGMYARPQSSDTCSMSSFFYYILYHETEVAFETRERLVRQIRLSLVEEAVRVPFVPGENVEKNYYEDLIQFPSATSQGIPINKTITVLGTAVIYEQLDMIQGYINAGELGRGLDLLGDLDLMIRSCQERPQEWQELWSSVRHRYFEVREWIRRHTEVLPRDEEEPPLGQVASDTPLLQPVPFVGRDTVGVTVPAIMQTERDAIDALKDVHSKEPIEAWRTLMNAIVIGAHRPELIEGLKGCEEVLQMIVSEHHSALYEIMLAAAQSKVFLWFIIWFTA